MKKVVLSGANGTVARAMMQELSDEYEMVGISLVRMDEVIAAIDQLEEPTWTAQLAAYRERLMEQMTTAFRGADAAVHLGWNTRGDNCNRGLDPLNILQVDVAYQAAIEEKVPRIYMASSVHAYDFWDAIEKNEPPIPPMPDTRVDEFGWKPSSLYGISKRWMEMCGQFYEPKLHPGQKILCVRLGAVNGQDHPGGEKNHHMRRLWDSYRDCAGLLKAFIECDESAPAFWTAFNISNNRSEAYPANLFDTVNPYGFVPQDNEHDVD
jgi:nucleoside-diphosphate-sugar epimerase